LSPTAAHLSQIDILIFDAQDIGTRYYTYAATMALCMRAARRAGVKVVVLDRPNPIGGLQIEGGGLDPGLENFCGLYPVPQRHALTICELARLYNDTFGHNAGDELLIAMGNLLKSQTRGEDIACRYGGEEFLLIMPGLSGEVALQRAERLRQAVKEMPMHRQGLNPITISLGVAVYPDNGDTGLQLIRSADAALYRAKQAGRDRVVTAQRIQGYHQDQSEQMGAFQ
jgi:diguanylate cyclase (GGDEF)-like protein